MSRRLRILLASIGGVLAAILLLPWGYGFVLESRVAGGFERLPEGLRPVSVSVRRGWFSSHVESVHPLPGSGDRITLYQDFTHGPFLLAGLVSDAPVLGIATWRIATRLDRPESPAPVDFGQGRGWLDHGGALRVSWFGERPRLDYAPRRDWLRVEGDGRGRWLLQGRVAELGAQSPAGDWRLRDWKLRAVLSRQASGLRIRELASSALGLRWDGRLGPVRIDDLRLRLSGESTAGTTRLDASLSRVETGGQPWGPGVFGLDVAGVDVQAVTAWLAGGEGPWYRALAGARFRISDFTLQGRGGRLKGAADLSVADRTPRAVPPGLRWMTSIDGEASFEIPDGWLRSELERVTRKRMTLDVAARDGLPPGRGLMREEIDERAANQTARRLMLFEQQGYLTRVRGAYRTAWVFDDGHVRINGKPVNLDQFVRK